MTKQELATNPKDSKLLERFRVENMLTTSVAEFAKLPQQFSMLFIMLVLKLSKDTIIACILPATPQAKMRL